LSRYRFEGEACAGLKFGEAVPIKTIEGASPDRGIAKPLMERTMKIDQPSGKVILDQVIGAKPAAAKESGATPVESEKVTLSRLSTQLHDMEARLGSADADIDVERVEAIKLAIRSGTFAVNPEAIADGLIASVRELVRR